jgi:hypothetical protein
MLCVEAFIVKYLKREHTKHLVNVITSIKYACAIETDSTVQSLKKVSLTSILTLELDTFCLTVTLQL